MNAKDLLTPVLVAVIGGVLAVQQVRIEGALAQKLENTKGETAISIASMEDRTKRAMSKFETKVDYDKSTFSTKAKLVEIFAPHLFSKEVAVRERAARVLAHAGGPDLRKALENDSDQSISEAARGVVVTGKLKVPKPKIPPKKRETKVFCSGNVSTPDLPHVSCGPGCTCPDKWCLKSVSFTIEADKGFELVAGSHYTECIADKGRSCEWNAVDRPSVSARRGPC